MAQQRIKPYLRMDHEIGRESIYGSNLVIRQAIKYLRPENTELIKLLLHEFETTQYTGQELAQLELRRNMTGNQLLACYGFDIQSIRERCSTVWSLLVQSSKSTAPLDRYSWMEKNCSTNDSDEFLYWTFILIQHDNIENPYPFTLFKMLQSRRLNKYCARKTAFMNCILANQ